MAYNKKDLKKHICALRDEGLEAAIEVLSDCPLVRCSHCGAEANSLRSVCAVHLDPLQAVQEPA